MKTVVSVSHPTLRHVAEAAGVSQMTVSRALGGRGRIAEATRAKIVMIAERLRYRPDPEVAKLMHHLRVRKRRQFQSVMVGLTTRRPDDQEWYFQAVVAGAAARAAGRGYGFEVVHVSPTGKNWTVVKRTLRGRGVEGVLFLPSQALVDLSGLLDWGNFSMVSASASVTGPTSHRVSPHHFDNSLMLCRNLVQGGSRRIGLVVSADHEVRTSHGFAAAVLWHGANEAAHAVPPLVIREGAELRRWFAREAPDTIIANELSSAREYARSLGLKIGGAVRFAVTSLMEEKHEGVSGIDERPGAIGGAAAEMLAGMVERRERGRPESPAVTLLNGRWVP
ncbi:MAG: hypothetical protein CK548_03135 [Opitutia bacterium]|nr:LacI family transcriptional regulator [Opitutaceae bacterium]PHX72787.1 MAG: hypothetical protein CK548_03135 [Opitutae bacterium]